MEVLVPLIAILPLAGFAITALVGRRLDREAHWIPVGMVVIAWAISMVVAFLALTHAEPFGEHGFGVTLYEWIPAGSFVVEAGFFVDTLRFELVEDLPALTNDGREAPGHRPSSRRRNGHSSCSRGRRTGRRHRSAVLR